MTYGLKITNPSGELVISSDAKGLTCIGRATLQGSVIQASGGPTSVSPGRIGGSSTYRILHSGPVIWAVDLPLNRYVGIIGTSQPFAGAWDVACHCGDSLDAFGFSTNQYAVDVWAFGFVPTLMDSYGMAIYDSAGTLSHDLSRPNLLFPRAFVEDSYGTPVTIPALSRPIAMGCPGSERRTQDRVSVNTWADNAVRGMWLRGSATNMSQVLAGRQRFQYSAVDPRDGTADDIYRTPSFILEGSLLP